MDTCFRVDFFSSNELATYGVPNDIQNTHSSFSYHQVLRGKTANLIYIDEACFIRPIAYTEALPMLQTDLCKVVLTSSHKLSRSSTEFLDITDLRSDEIILNNVTGVCKNHISSMLSENVTSMFCMCNAFSEPDHQKADSEFRRISNTFSRSIAHCLNTSSTKNGGTNDGSSTHNDVGDVSHKEALLSEMGILVGAEDLKDIENCGRYNLATTEAFEALCSNLIPVHDHTVGSHGTSNSALVFDREITVYIDPSPTNAGSSFHAMCFVTRAHRVRKPTDDDDDGGTTGSHGVDQHFTIMAVQDFEAADVDEETRDGAKAMAAVFMETCDAIDKIYGGYFTQYYVAPEANSFNIDPFWINCQSLFRGQYAHLKESSRVSILATTISKLTGKAKLQNKIQDTDSIVLAKTLLSTQDYMSTLHSAAAASSSSTAPTTSEKRQMAEQASAQSYATYKAEMRLKENIQVTTTDYDDMRIGYVMGASKVMQIFSFYRTIYNPSRSNKCDLRCASFCYGSTIRDRLPNASLPYYIGEALEVLELKSYNTGVGKKTTYKISGKKTKSTGFIRDDLAIAIVMSVTLCDEINSGKFKGVFVRL